MVRYDLTKESDRLALVELVFIYPAIPHKRKHGPRGYTTLEPFREWLRDEFSYRCVFSLVRETWPDSGGFEIDHLEPRATRPDLIYEYDNLLYLTHRLNLIRGKRAIPDPGQIALGKCLRVNLQGDRFGYVETLNPIGEQIERIFNLNSEKAVACRVMWLAILRSLAITDENGFRRMMGYPSDLYDLELKKETENSRKDGLKQSAHYLRAMRILPEWY
jgi:hypothetical protein